MARASFPTLPLELKAKIVEMTSWKEDAWDDRVEDGKDRKAHIDGLSLLGLVNKKFRQLAAKHLFSIGSGPRVARI